MITVILTVAFVAWLASAGCAGRQMKESPYERLLNHNEAVRNQEREQRLARDIPFIKE